MMRPHRPRASVLAFSGALLCAALTLGGPAHAQLTPAQKQEVREHYDKAARAYDVQKFAEAIEEYQKTYEISGDPAMLFNVAQAYRLNSQPQEAVFYYRRYLERSPLAPNRADVEQKIADLEKTLEATRKPPAASPPPALPPPPAAPASPGGAQPPASSPAAGSPSNESVSSAPRPAAATPTFPPPHVITVPSESGGRNGKRVAGLALVSLGAAGLLTAAITGKLAENKGDNLTYASTVKGTFDPNTERSGKTLDNVAVASVVIGSGAAVAGVVFLILSRHPSSEQAATGRAPAAAKVAAVAPLVSPGTVGATAVLSF